MLRRFALTVTVLAALAAAFPAAAQGAGDRRPFGFGIGANASFQETTGAFPFEIYFPFRIGPTLKVEPSLGILTADADGADFSDVMVGVGVFAVRRISAPVDLYFGGRLKLDFVSADLAGGGDESDTDFYVTAAAGGEYFVVPAFSLGLEANLGYYSLGELSNDQSGLYTTGIFMLRMYL